MPSAINTGGFQVSNLPQINFLDPRLLTPDYTRFLPGVDQGLNTVLDAGKVRDADIARQAELQTQAARIAAQNANNQLSGAQALTNLQLLPQAATLKQAQTGSDLAQIPSSTTAAIAANTRRGLTDTAALPNIAPAAQNEGTKLAIDASNLNFDKTQLPTLQYAQGQNNAASAVTASAAPSLAQAKNTAAAGAVAGDIDQQQLQKIKTQTDTIAANTAQSLQQQKSDFLAANPSLNQNQLLAALLSSQQALDGLKGVQEATKDLPDFYKQKAESDYYSTLASVARAKTEAANVGLKPDEIVRGAEMQFKGAEAQREGAKTLQNQLDTLASIPVTPQKNLAQFAADLSDRKRNEDGSYEGKIRDLAHGHYGYDANASRDALLNQFNVLSKQVGSLTPAQLNPSVNSTSALLSGLSPLSQVQLTPTPAPTPGPALPPRAPAVPLGYTPNGLQIPQQAIQMLRANPSLKSDFENTYGVNAAPYLQ
jgi:hypothetical protein